MYDSDQPRIALIDDVGRPVPAEIEFMTFPGGEPHVKIYTLPVNRPVSVDARIRTFEDVGYLLVLVDALKRRGVKLDRLLVPYFPGSRQDRAQHGGPLTAAVYADLFVGLGFETIWTLDPHSHVCTALAGAHTMGAWWTDIHGRCYDIVVAPDAGAQHRAVEFAREYNVGRVVQALKHRDPKTGELSGFEVLAERDVSRPRIVVADDICDGGGTFLPLADLLWEKFPEADVDLVVTHGIFSKGTNALLNKFERIYASTSFLSSEQLAELNVRPLKLYPQEAI